MKVSIVIGLLLILVAFVFWVPGQLTSQFADEDRWHHWVSNTSNSDTINSYLSGLLNNLEPKAAIIHLVDDSCWCQSLSTNHIKSLDKLAIENDVTRLQVKKSDLPEQISRLIPSFPAVIILNKNQIMSYFGPYSDGISCSTNNGFVETLLINQHNNENSLLSTQYNFFVDGCFCQNKL